MKPLKKYFLLFSISLISLELLLRVFFAFKVGPDVLIYGFQQKKGLSSFEKQNNVAIHENNTYGTSKYYPYQIRFDKDSLGKSFKVRMNNYGYRGIDFGTSKPKNTLRIITLGASSTFGYGNHDNQTYPYYLESLLNNRIADNKHFFYNKVEVLNFGIPHLTSEEIYLQLQHEGLKFQPDVITFYEGINDAANFYRRYEKQNDIYSNVFIRHSLLLKLAVFIIKGKSETYDKLTFEAYLKGKCERFIDNVAKIKQLCQTNNIKFIVMLQQSQPISLENSVAKKVTYSEEASAIKLKLEHSPISSNEAYFLTHTYLMDSLKNWCYNECIEMVDGIKILDDKRFLLSSWVHLYPYGNYLLADSLAEKILRHNP